MRIALALEHFDPRLGGAEQWTYQFARGVIAAGHEVHVVSESISPAAKRLGFIPHLLKRASNRLALAAAVERRLRELQADVVHDMGVGWHCDVFQPHGGSRLASLEHTLQIYPAWMRPAKRWISRLLPRHREFEQLTARQFADRGQVLLALSQMVARHFQQYHGADPQRIRLVYNGVDTERFSPANRRLYRTAVRSQLGIGDEPLFLIVAHNFRLKGVPALVQAMGRLRSAGERAHLAVVGGKSVNSFARMAQRVGAGSTVTFLGQREDPTPYYAAADGYVQPTYYDPCSLVALEALASGLPVITSRFNGVSELLSPGVHGFVLNDPGDISTLTQQMTTLLDPKIRRRMGEAARELALDHRWERNVNEILALYETVGRRAGRAFAC